MDMPEVLERAKKQLAETTGLTSVAVSRAFKDEEGWHVGIEMLEMSRIPAATDVLGYYDVLLTEEGGMVRFGRKRTRLRGEPKEEEQ